MSKIVIFGGGSWGTALALTCAHSGHDVVLWVRCKAQANTIRHHRENKNRLPGVILPPTIRATTEFENLSGADLYLCAVPAQSLRVFLQSHGNKLNAKVPFILCSKGIEISSGLLLQEVVASEDIANPLGVLSGPNFAKEIALGLPAASTFALKDETLAYNWSKNLSTPSFRLYPSTDVIGVECGGSLKNVLAIAAGLVTGAGLGENTRAALITRGLAEIRRFSQLKGAQPETLMGLSGIGDLMLCTSSKTSRNMELGYLIGQSQKNNKTFDKKLPLLTEGAHTVQAIMNLLERIPTLDLPICASVYRILYEDSPILTEMKTLLERPLKFDTGRSHGNYAKAKRF